MNDAECLNLIKQEFEKNLKDGLLNLQVKWLIDQANKVERLEKALDRIGFYCAGSEFNHVSNFILKVKSGEEKSL